MIRKMRIRRCALMGALMMLLVGTSSCAESKAYDIPEALCGRAIESTDLKPLLPGGGKVEGKQQDTDEISSSCSVSVDQKVVLMIIEYRDQNAFDMIKHAMERQSRRNPEKSKVAENSVISDGNFLSMSPCRARGQKSNYILDISMAAPPSDTKKLRKELEKFAASYLPEGLKEMGCVK